MNGACPAQKFDTWHKSDVFGAIVITQPYKHIYTYTYIDF